MYFEGKGGEEREGELGRGRGGKGEKGGEWELLLVYFFLGRNIPVGKIPMRHTPPISKI